MTLPTAPSASELPTPLGTLLSFQRAGVALPARRRGRPRHPAERREPRGRRGPRAPAGERPRSREGAVKRYKEVLAVDHIDLNVDAGDVYGFLGPNGAGKTTTLRMASG